MLPTPLIDQGLFRSVRTSLCTRFEGGGHAPEIAARAGHRTQTIMDRYRHILPRTEDRVNERLEAIYREARRSRG